MIAVLNISKIVVIAPIWEPIFIKRNISMAGIKKINSKIEFICLQSKLLVEINQHSNYIKGNEL